MLTKASAPRDQGIFDNTSTKPSWPRCLYPAPAGGGAKAGNAKPGTPPAGDAHRAGPNQPGEMEVADRTPNRSSLDARDNKGGRKVKLPGRAPGARRRQRQSLTKATTSAATTTRARGPAKVAFNPTRPGQSPRHVTAPTPSAGDPPMRLNLHLAPDAPPARRGTDDLAGASGGTGTSVTVTDQELIDTHGRRRGFAPDPEESGTGADDAGQDKTKPRRDHRANQDEPRRRRLERPNPEWSPGVQSASPNSPSNATPSNRPHQRQAEIEQLRRERDLTLKQPNSPRQHLVDLATRTRPHPHRREILRLAGASGPEPRAQDPQEPRCSSSPQVAGLNDAWPARSYDRETIQVRHDETAINTASPPEDHQAGGHAIPRRPHPPRSSPTAPAAPPFRCHDRQGRHQADAQRRSATVTSTRPPSPEQDIL